MKRNQDIRHLSTSSDIFSQRRDRILGKITTEWDLSPFFIFLPLIIFSSLGTNSGHDENNREPERGGGGEWRKEGLRRRSCNKGRREKETKTYPTIRRSRSRLTPAHE